LRKVRARATSVGSFRRLCHYGKCAYVVYLCDLQLFAVPERVQSLIVFILLLLLLFVSVISSRRPAAPLFTWKLHTHTHTHTHARTHHYYAKARQLWNKWSKSHRHRVQSYSTVSADIHPHLTHGSRLVPWVPRLCPSRNEIITTSIIIIMIMTILKAFV